MPQAKEDGKGSGGGMFRGLIDTIIGNLQLSISNIHIRYEVSNACTICQTEGFEMPPALHLI